MLFFISKRKSFVTYTDLANSINSSSKFDILLAYPLYNLLFFKVDYDQGDMTILKNQLDHTTFEGPAIGGLTNGQI